MESEMESYQPITDAQRTKFWYTVQKLAGKPVPNLVKNIFKYEHLDRWDAWTPVPSRKAEHRCTINYERLKARIRSQHYMTFVNSSILEDASLSREDFYGPYENEPDQFDFIGGIERFFENVLAVLDVINDKGWDKVLKKSRAPVKKRGRPPKTNETDENNTMDESVHDDNEEEFEIDETVNDVETTKLKKILSNEGSYPPSFRNHICLIDCKVYGSSTEQQDLKARVTCPDCDPEKVFEFAKTLDKGTYLWKASNFTRHVKNVHALDVEKQALLEKSEQRKIQVLEKKKKREQAEKDKAEKLAKKSKEKAKKKSKDRKRKRDSSSNDESSDESSDAANMEEQNGENYIDVEAREGREEGSSNSEESSGSSEDDLNADSAGDDNHCRNQRKNALENAPTKSITKASKTSETQQQFTEQLNLSESGESETENVTQKNQSKNSGLKNKDVKENSLQKQNNEKKKNQSRKGNKLKERVAAPIHKITQPLQE